MHELISHCSHFAVWGASKPNLAWLIKKHLLAQLDTVTVWFNTWRFEQEQHAIIPLVAIIIRCLEYHKPILDKPKEKGKPLITVLAAYPRPRSAPGAKELETHE